MKTIQIQGDPRQASGKRLARKMRKEGNIPAILYGKGLGKKKALSFSLSMGAIEALKGRTCLIDLVLEGRHHACILQAKQFHPVSDLVIHADFLTISPKEAIEMMIPLTLSGNAPGVREGGLLVQRIRKLKVRALPQKMPQELVAEISNLALGKTMRVREITRGDYTLLAEPSLPIAIIEVPRALRSKTEADAPAKSAN